MRFSKANVINAIAPKAKKFNVSSYEEALNLKNSKFDVVEYGKAERLMVIRNSDFELFINEFALAGKKIRFSKANVLMYIDCQNKKAKKRYNFPEGGMNKEFIESEENIFHLAAYGSYLFLQDVKKIVENWS